MVGNLVEVSMVITKASLQPDGSMRWQAVVSDTSPDNTGESTSIPLFQDWIKRTTTGQKVDWLPAPRMPFLGISHYSDLEGAGEAGVTEKMYIDGDKFKASGIFYDNPLGRALFAAVKAEADLVRRGEVVSKPVRISAAWWDIGHSHGSFNFERKSLTDICPMCAKGESANKIYLMGQTDHFASTRVPINPRTSILTERAMTTRKEDAATIVGDELAEELEEKSLLVGKSETDPAPAIVVKAKKPPFVKEEEEEESEEEMEEKPKGKKKPMADKAAVTWEAAKALPEAKSFSRVDLMGLVRRNIAEQPEEERESLIEAMLDDMISELNEVKTAVEELYFTQPAVEDALLAEDYGEEETVEYLETFSQQVTEALSSDLPAAQKAETIQKALNSVALAIKADLETPVGSGDMVAALKAALAPLNDGIAQLNARLNMGPQQVITMPVQKSMTVPTVAQQQSQSQLPVSPVTGQPSSITAAVRRTTIPGY